jgi:hypothetical protein
MTRRLLAIAAMTLVIAACSGSPDASSPDDGGAGSSSGAEPSAAASSGGGGGGGGAAAACDLITADEAASVMGVDSLESQPTPGDTSYCTYSGADATTLVATSFNASNASDIMAAFGGQAGVTEVSGIGDQALWDSNSATLFVAKGDAIIGITVGDGSMDLAQRQDLSEQLGAIAAGRM